MIVLLVVALAVLVVLSLGLVFLVFATGAIDRHARREIEELQNGSPCCALPTEDP